VFVSQYSVTVSRMSWYQHANAPPVSARFRIIVDIIDKRLADGLLCLACVVAFDSLGHCVANESREFEAGRSVL
jgi:hypothetical protein